MNKNFISLSDDLLFREVFSHPDNQEALKYFVEAILHLPRHSIKDFEISFENHLLKTKHNLKSCRGDIIINYDNKMINIECYNVFDHKSLLKSIIYWARLISNIYIGQHYKSAKDVIQINIINRVKVSLPKKFKINYCLTDENNINNKLFKNKFQIIFLRVDLLSKTKYNENDLELKWIRFINAQSYEERMNIAKGDRILMSLQEWVDNYVNVGIFKENMMYLNREIEITRQKELAYEEGIEQGIEQGIEHGKEQIITNMKNKGYSMNDISNITGIPLKELRQLTTN